MNTTRLTLIIFTLAAAIGLLILLPSDKEKPETPPRKVKTVSFFHYFSGALSGGIDEMVEEVNASSETFTVLARPLDHEAFKTMIPTSFERGNPPELFSYWAGAKVNQLVADNRLLPLDDIWESEKLAEKFPPAIVKSAIQYGDQKYLLPITQHIVLFFYNKQVFNALNLSPPKNWQEFLALCTSLLDHGIVPLALGAKERWPAQFWFDYLMLRNVGPDIRQRLMQGQLSYTDPGVVDTFRIWAELVQAGFFNDNANELDWAEATVLVRQGEAAMTLMGTWAIQSLEDGEKGLRPGEEYDFFTFPVITPGVPEVSVGPIDGIVIAREAENSDLAKDVLTFFASREAQQRMSDGSGALSPDTTVPENAYSPLKLRIKEVIDHSDQWAFNYDLATPGAVADRGLDSFSELIAFPSQYHFILKDLQKEIVRLRNNQ